MSRMHDRDQLVAQLTRELPEVSLYEVVELARKLLRAGTTLQRLTEAQCNGDWPYDAGRRPADLEVGRFALCDRCEQDTRKIQLKQYRYGPHFKGPKPRCLLCPDCRTQDRVKALLHPYGLVPRFDGDPRGPVLRVFRREVDWQRVENGSERGIYVS